MSKYDTALSVLQEASDLIEELLPWALGEPVFDGTCSDIDGVCGHRLCDAVGCVESKRERIRQMLATDGTLAESSK